MPFEIIRADITKVKADAVVNTANPEPVAGRGTDLAIYRAAGRRKLLAERRKIGRIEPGECAYTDAFGLDAKYIIHTVGPVWQGGKCGERDILRRCYESSLELAERLGCESVAFPLISSGVYGFPKAEALSIALSGIGSFLLTHEMQITLVVFDKAAVELSDKLTGGIEKYIDEHTVCYMRDAEYGPEEERRRTQRLRRAGNAASHILPAAAQKIAPADLREDALPPSAAGIAPAAAKESSFADLSGKSLEEVLSDRGETFQQKLLKLIDESGMDDVTVYKKANIDRKLFSRIRCNEDYQPTKKTAVAFAIALRLDMQTMTDLLSRAGIAFSDSSRFDLIIAYFVNNRIYDIFEINAALFKYDQPLLGQ